MNNYCWIRSSVITVMLTAALLLGGAVFAADHVSGQVTIGGAPWTKRQ